MGCLFDLSAKLGILGSGLLGLMGELREAGLKIREFSWEESAKTVIV